MNPALIERILSTEESVGDQNYDLPVGDLRWLKVSNMSFWIPRTRFYLEPCFKTIIYSVLELRMITPNREIID